MVRLFDRLEQEISPLILTGFIVFIMLVMSIFIVFFGGELVTLTDNENQNNLNYCNFNVSLGFDRVCEDNGRIKISLTNNGHVDIDSFVFQSVESSNNLLTESSSILYINHSSDYLVNVNDISSVDQVLVSPVLEINNEKINCPAKVYPAPSNLLPCNDISSLSNTSNTTRRGSGGGGGGSSGSTPSCSDFDGDGYGDNCNLGSDCDDSNNQTWQSVNVYLDSDQDGYGSGDALEPICVGQINQDLLGILLSLSLSINNYDCDDDDQNIFFLMDFYLDEDHDSYGIGEIIHTACWGVGGNYDYPLDEMSFNNDDCDDLDPDINPGALEDCRDLIDQDCDRDLCLNCYIGNWIPGTGCRCRGIIYYSGYCCDDGWDSVSCFEIEDPGIDLPGEPQLSFWEKIFLKPIFNLFKI